MNERIVFKKSGFSYKPLMKLSPVGSIDYKRSFNGERLYQFELNGIELGEPREIREIEVIANWLSEIDIDEVLNQQDIEDQLKYLG